MSDQIFLAMAVVGTFLAVLLARVAWVAGSKQRQPSQVLQAQLHSAGVAMPGETSARFSERVVGPIASALANLAARLTPAGARDKIADKRVLALKGLGLILGLFVGYLVGGLVSLPLVRVVAIPVFAMIGYLIPGSILS